MADLWQHLGAASGWGPGLCGTGLVALIVAAGVHGVGAKPTILRDSGVEPDRPPAGGERLSLHLIVYPVWAIGFGAVVWRGVPAGMIDVRLAGEKTWPVLQAAEWIYLSSYVVPLAVPWLARSRAALRDYAIDLWCLLFASALLFLWLPLGAPPRAFVPDSLAGRMLAWETARGDFAAAAFPSFHVCWALLCARFFATLGRGWAWTGRAWAAAVTFSCVATGAHAIADVAAALLIYPLVTGAAFFRPRRRAAMKPVMSPSPTPPSPK